VSLSLIALTLGSAYNWVTLVVVLHQVRG
jgi:hypothetical protein